MKILALSSSPLNEAQGSGYIIKGLKEKGYEMDLYGPEHYEFMPFLKHGKQLRLVIGMLLIALKNIFCRHCDIVELRGGESELAAVFYRCA